VTPVVHRCAWAGDDPLMVAYHDEEWGVPSHNDAHLFEMLTLEGAQSGLSWMTILRKREGYRRAFKQFDAASVAQFTARDIQHLMQDTGIVRNRSKIESTVDNAHAIMTIVRSHGSLDAFLWSAVDGKPMIGARRTVADVPGTTPASDALSKLLKKHGFRFVGPTTCYAFMQAVGMVDDHETSCFRHTRRRSLARSRSHS
jgi:DNA-3-methyladenine glycosylase I